MTVPSVVVDEGLELRARQSLGSSHDAIYAMVAHALEARGAAGGRLVDVGCGGGGLWRVLGSRFSSYCGIDAVRYDEFPIDVSFRHADLDRDHWPIDDNSADVVVAIEIIEHLENPWAFVSGLVRIGKPNAWIVVTTPNQLSMLSLATLVAKQRFSAFQDVHYPAHRTSLLECDLQRIAHDRGLTDIHVAYSQDGRLPLTSRHYPRYLTQMFPRALSDNLMLIGRKPDV